MNKIYPKLFLKLVIVTPIPDSRISLQILNFSEILYDGCLQMANVLSQNVHEMSNGHAHIIPDCGHMRFVEAIFGLLLGQILIFSMKTTLFD